MSATETLNDSPASGALSAPEVSVIVHVVESGADVRTLFRAYRLALTELGRSHEIVVFGETIQGYTFSLLFHCLSSEAWIRGSFAYCTLNNRHPQSKPGELLSTYNWRYSNTCGIIDSAEGGANDG